MEGIFSWLWQEDAEDQYVALAAHPGDASATSTLPPQRRLTEHDYVVYALTFAFDNSLVSGSYEVIRVDDVKSGSVTREIFGDFDWVYSLAMVYGVTPLIVSAHRDNYIRAWDYFDAENNVPLFMMLGHTSAVLCVSVLQGAEPVLLSSSFDGTLRAWDLSNEGAALHVMKGHEHGVRAVAVSNDAHPKVVSGDDNGNVFVWSLREGKLEKKIKGSRSAVKGLAVTACARQLIVIAREDGTVAVRFLDTGLLMRSFRAHATVCRCLSVWQDKEPVLVTGGYDMSVRTWDLLSCEPLHLLSGAHSHEVYAVSVSAGGPASDVWIASTGADCAINIWNMTQMLKNLASGEEESFI